MTTIFFNHTQSKIHPLEESMGLRIAYLLSTKVLSAGGSFAEMYFEKWYNEITRIDDMITRIEIFYQNQPEEDFKKGAADSRKVWKFLNKVKHPNAEVIARKKQFSKSITDLFEGVKAEEVDFHKSLGLVQLQPLHEKEELEFYPVQVDAPETQNEEYGSASKLLLLQLKESEFYSPPFLFVLPPQFFLEYLTDKKKLSSALNLGIFKTDRMYAEHCFSFPNLNFLTATELQTIRRQLQEPLKPFIEKVDQWINMPRNKAGSVESQYYFMKTVLPTSAPLLAGMGENELLQHCSRSQNDEVSVDVYLGEAPVEIIWEYYRKFDIVKDETWTILMEHQSNPVYKERWPFMTFMKGADKEIPVKQKKEQYEIAPVKKSLKID